MQGDACAGDKELGEENAHGKHTMNAQANRPDERCFGQQSPTAPECIGGPDAGYEHPQTGAHTREACKWYQACGDHKARLAASGSAAMPPIVPPQNLVRHPTIIAPVPAPVRPGVPSRAAKPVAAPQPYIPRPPAPVVHPQYPYQQYPAQPQPQQQYQQQAPVAVHVGYAPPHVAQLGPQQVPVSVQQPGAAMPHYLTNPEPIDGGTGAALGRTLVRSAAKAIGHSISAFFDHTPLKSHKPPPPQ